MSAIEDGSQRYELRTETDLLAALDELGVEHLDVDASRTFVCYCEAVLDLQTVEGTLAAARAVTVTSQGFAWNVSKPDPTAVIRSFCRDLVAATDTGYR